jgi:hypothetical protein
MKSLKAGSEERGEFGGVGCTGISEEEGTDVSRSGRVIRKRQVELTFPQHLRIAPEPL